MIIVQRLKQIIAKSSAHDEDNTPPELMCLRIYMQHTQTYCRACCKRDLIKGMEAMNVRSVKQ